MRRRTVREDLTIGAVKVVDELQAAISLHLLSDVVDGHGNISKPKFGLHLQTKFCYKT